MNRTLSVVVLTVVLSGLALGQVRPRAPSACASLAPVPAASPRDSASPPRHPLYQHNRNFFEFVFHQLNPANFDWGAWYEARRQALLEATTCNPDFWYCLTATLTFLVTFAGLLKSVHDDKRKTRIMDQKMEELRQHDAYSRRVANETIHRYNAHTELCNRVIEAEEGGLAIATGEGSQVSQLQADLAKAREEIEILKREKSRLGAEITRPSSPAVNLSHRSILPSNKEGGNGQSTKPPTTEAAPQADLVRQINSLQQQLYAEREKNKHLKGGV